MSFNSVNTIIEDAAALIGNLKYDQSISGDLIQKGIRFINFILRDWGSNQIYIAYTQQVTLPLEFNKYSYTIGDEDIYDLDTRQIIAIKEMHVISPVDGDLQYPMIPMTEQMYNNLYFPPPTGIPARYLLRLQDEYSELKIYPAPSQDMTAHLLCRQKLSTLGINDTTLELPDSACAALTAKLAIVMSQSLGYPMAPDQKMDLENTINNFLTVNVPIDVSFKKDEVITSNIGYTWWYKGF